LQKASGLFVYNVAINNNSVVQWQSDLLVKEISINLYKPLTCRKSMANLSYKNVWNNPRLIDDDKKTLTECNFNRVLISILMLKLVKKIIHYDTK
jgi:hypothetical protein